MRGVILNLDKHDRVMRATSALQHENVMGRPLRGPWDDVQYCLDSGKNGGTDPRAPDCASVWQGKDGRTYRTSDCIGFALWAYGWDRFQPYFPIYGGWLNTTSIILALESGSPWVREAEFGELGSLVVYPGYRKFGIMRPGHIGVVTGSAGPALYSGANVSVVHCHGPRLRGRAIHRASADQWLKFPRARFVHLIKQ